MKVCRARVIPLFPVYNGKTHRLTIQIRPPMDDLLTADDHTIARRMNEEVEIFVGPHPNSTPDPEAAQNPQAARFSRISVKIFIPSINKASRKRGFMLTNPVLPDEQVWGALLNGQNTRGIG